MSKSFISILYYTWKGSDTPQTLNNKNNLI